MIMGIRRLSEFSDKLIGLAFKNKIEPAYLETRWGIHTFFVRKSIDVVIADDNFIVRKIVRNLKPWRILFWNPKYKKVLELPANYKKYSQIKIGDVISR